MSRRILTLAAAVVTALLLSACAGLPTTGPVEVGLSGGTDSDAPEFVLKPDSPQPGSTADQIVAGFLRAGSGPVGGWAVAREYLAANTKWDPYASVTIDVGERTYTQPADDAVSVMVTQTALVDAGGAYSPTEAGATTLDFRLVQEDGEWRISQAPPGVVLNQNVFPNVFHRYPVMFFDTAWSYLVPDLRWFPTSNAATRITKALFEGASPWLAGSIRTAVPDSVSAPSAVPIVSSVAQVELGTATVAVDRTTLDRLQTQLEASLQQAGASAVEMLAGGTPLEAERVPTTSTAVTAAPLVLTAEGFGFLTADTLDPIPGLSDAVLELPSPPLSVQLGVTQTEAAARLASGTVVRVSADREFEEVDARPGMIDPTIDRFGYIWTATRNSPGDLRATGPNGTPVPVQNAWNGASEITAMAVSRDGTRLAALVETGGRTWVWIKGIVRGAEGAPTALGELLEVAEAPGGGIGLTWLDDATLGVLSAGDEQPVAIEQPIGGPGSTVAAPSGAVAIAGANQTATVRLRDADGNLFIKRGTNWNRTAGDVVVLGTQQGSLRAP